MGIIIDNSQKDMAVEKLIQFLFDDHPSVRSKSAWALGKIRNSDAIIPLLNALTDTHPDVRKNVLRSLGELEARDFTEHIYPLLHDRDSDVRNEAALVLDYLGWQPSTVEDKICHLIAREKWEDIPAFEYDALGPILPYLDDDDKDVVCNVAWVLGEIKSSAAVQPIFDKFMTSTISDVRECLARSLGNIGSDEAVNLLLAAIHDSNWLIRKCAVDALGDSGNLLALNPLLDMVKDDNPYVRKSAMIAVQKIRDQVRKS